MSKFQNKLQLVKYKDFLLIKNNKDNIYYYQNNFYLELNKPINKRKYLDILEKSEILYNDTYKVINEGLKIKV